MTRRLKLSVLAALLLTAGLAGCMGNDEDVDPNAADLGPSTLTILGTDGPVAFATVTALDATGSVLATLSSGPSGNVSLQALPPATTEVVITAQGHVTWRGGLSGLPTQVTLEAVDRAPLVDPEDPTPALTFLEPLLMGGAYLGGQGESCQVYNCGASEPTVEVAGDGTVYVSGVCCVGESPPIWVSRDNGFTFHELEGDVLRDTFGIEGDFAIDDAGNMYFTDISVASAYISSWDAEGEHRHTTPLGPFPPLVDRPWVRAGAEDVVYFAYNTGTSTRVHTSTDGGQTWDLGTEFPGSLGALGQGPERDHLWLAVRGTLYESTDGASTWEEVGEIPTPTENGNTFQAYWVPVVDELGNTWIVYDWRPDGDDGAYHIYAARLDPSGTWHGPFQVSPEEGTHHLAWPATGKEGTLVVAWYGTLEDEAGPNDVKRDATWHVFTSVTVDGTSEEPSFQTVKADPLPVHEGPMNRKLLDFLQVDIGPEGAIHLAYAQDRGDRPDELTQYVRSTTGLALAPEVYPNGPDAASANGTAEARGLGGLLPNNG